jgi:hypothetical protein
LNITCILLVMFAVRIFYFLFFRLLEHLHSAE